MPKQRAAFHAGKFVRHVVPAAFKPVHSLWHEILGFTFLLFAGVATWKIVRNPGTLEPPQLALLGIFIVVMVLYGVSSLRKARRISRS